MKSINVLGRRIKIVYQKKLIRNDHPVDGYYCRKTKTIFIEEALEDDEKMITLYHEIGHALAYRTGMNQTVPHEIQELYAEQYAQLMFDIFGFM